MQIICGRSLERSDFSYEMDEEKYSFLFWHRAHAFVKRINIQIFVVYSAMWPLWLTFAVACQFQRCFRSSSRFFLWFLHNRYVVILFRLLEEEPSPFLYGLHAFVYLIVYVCAMHFMLYAIQYRSIGYLWKNSTSQNGIYCYHFWLALLL